MKIVFFGTPKIAADILESLAKTKFNPQLVITGEDSAAGRGRKITETPVKIVAKKHAVKTLEPQNLDNKGFVKELKDFAPDVAILVAYGKIIPDEILQIPKFGFVNIHPSLLPKYRGPSPIISAILNGDKITGSTVIVLDSELDHGPIIAQAQLSISDTDTHDSLANKLANLGSKLIIKTLPAYLDQNITPQAQDHNLATYTEKVTKQNGEIDLENSPDPQTLDRMIRAYYPWPTVWFELTGKKIKLLPENKIQPEGKKPMTIKEFSNGYPMVRSVLEKLFPTH